MPLGRCESPVDRDKICLHVYCHQEVIHLHTFRWGMNHDRDAVSTTKSLPTAKTGNEESLNPEV